MIRSIFTLPTTKKLNFEERERERNILFFSIATMAIFLVFGVTLVIAGNPIIGTVEFLSGLLVGANVLYLRRTENVNASARFLVFLVFLMSLIIFINGGIAGTGNLWLLLFPIFALLLRGAKEGMSWIIVYFLLINILVLLHYLDFITLHFDFLTLRQTFIAFLSVVILSYANEKVKIEARKEIKATNERLLEKDRMLMEHSKVVETGKVMKDISEQFQRPLNNLSLTLQNLPDDFEDGRIDKPYVDKLVNDSLSQIHYISHVMDDFRLLFQKSSTKDYFTVERIVQNAHDFLASSLKGYYITFEFHNETSSEIYNYEGCLLRAFFNLLNNAKDAIIARRKETGNNSIGLIMVNAYEDQENLYIHINDDAGVLPDKIISRIFDPIYATEFQTKPRVVGIYMSKMIIEKSLGGSLNVANYSDGVRFTISLPKQAS